MVHMDRNKARELAKALVGRMTVEERASQLRFDAPAIERLGVPAYNWWNEALHGVARGGSRGGKGDGAARGGSRDGQGRRG